MKQGDKMFYDVQGVINAECNLQPMRCRHCGEVGEVTYFDTIGDAHCELCGYWQLDEA